jgi:NAD(P)-dependent dehydrogenase (short-subunit alcohol dehydrogenase family)
LLCRERQTDPVTGATNGIGLAAAEALAALGANLAIVGRSKTKTSIALARIRAAAGRGATVATFIADLSSQASVRRLAAEVLARYRKLDVLVNNAGAMYRTRQLTKDGIEPTWAVNHLAPFLLSKLLEPMLSVLPCAAFSLERPCEKLRFFQQHSLPVLRHLSIFL